MAESKLRNLSVEFSVKIIKLCENIKGHYSLTNQIERSGTSERMEQENNKPTSNTGTSAKAFGALLIISGIIIDVISMFLIFSSSFSSFGTLTIIGTIAFLIGLAIISNS